MKWAMSSGVALLCAGWFGAAQAAVIAEHSGATDPTTEGFVEAIGVNPNTTAGPVFGDMGFDAWVIDKDGGSVSGGGIGYNATISAADVADGATFGWRLSTRLRVVDAPDPGAGQPGIGFDATPFIAYRDGTSTYQIHFGSEADGDPIAYVPTAFPPSPAGTSFTLQGGGDGYHLYELLYDPVGGLDLFIDGVERLSDLAVSPLALSEASVQFGAGSSCCIGQGNYNLVRFETFAPSPDADDVPAPGTLMLCLAGLAGFGWFRRRGA